VPDILNKLIQHSTLDKTVCGVIDVALQNTTNQADQQEDPLSCSDDVDPFIYQITLAMGIIFSFCYASIGFSITKFGKRNLLGKTTTKKKHV
jgi:hypothetical protein